jgi:hypothetical protein
MPLATTQNRRRLNGLLTFWVAVVGIGASVSHSHALGWQPHTHGSAWLPPLAPRPSDDASDGPRVPHRHLILLGVELSGESLPDTTVTNGESVESIADHGMPSLDGDFRIIDPAPSAFVVIQQKPSDRATISQFRPMPLSTFALHTVTGVLRL